MKDIAVNTENLEDVKEAFKERLAKMRKKYGKGALNTDFKNEEYIKGLMSKTKDNENNKDDTKLILDVIASNDGINVILFDESDEFVCEINTSSTYDINLEQDGIIMIKLKSSLTHFELVKNIIEQRTFAGKAILKSTIRDLEDNCYSIKVFTDKINLIKYKVGTLEGNYIAQIETTFAIPSDAYLDYEIIKLEYKDMK